MTKVMSCLNILRDQQKTTTYLIGSMYGIFPYIYHIFVAIYAGKYPSPMDPILEKKGFLGSQAFICDLLRTPFDIEVVVHTIIPGRLKTSSTRSRSLQMEVGNPPKK